MKLGFCAVALWAMLGLGVLAQTVGQTNARPQEAGTTYTEYAQSIERVARTLDERAHLLENNARALSAARRVHRTIVLSPIPIPDVHVPPAPLPGPPRFSPSLDDWLQANLNAAARRKDDPARQAAILRATAATLRHTAESLSAVPATAPRDVAPTLASILAQPAYHEHENAAEAQVHKTLWQIFIEWFVRLFERLFSGLFGAAAATPLFGRLISIVTIILIVLLVMLMVYRLARYFLARRRAAVPADAGESLPVSVPASELYVRALSAAAHGQYALAISLAFRAALMQLDRNGIVAYDAARTAGEYRRALRSARAAAAPPFDELARSFTMATYAEMPADEGAWHAADRAYRHFEPLVSA